MGCVLALSIVVNETQGALDTVVSIQVIDVSELGIADFLGCRDKVILASRGIVGALRHMQWSLGPVAVLIPGSVVCLNLFVLSVREVMADAK